MKSAKAALTFATLCVVIASAVWSFTSPERREVRATEAALKAEGHEVLRLAQAPLVAKALYLGCKDRGLVIVVLTALPARHNFEPPVDDPFIEKAHVSMSRESNRMDSTRFETTALYTIGENHDRIRIGPLDAGQRTALVRGLLEENANLVSVGGLERATYFSIASSNRSRAFLNECGLV